VSFLLKKTFMSFFDVSKKRKSMSSGMKRKHTGTSSKSKKRAAPSLLSRVNRNTEEIGDNSDDCSDLQSDDEEQANDQLDMAKSAADDEVTSSIQTEAIEKMKASGVDLSEIELCEARGLLGKVSIAMIHCVFSPNHSFHNANSNQVAGLARTVHRSDALRNKLADLVATEGIVGQKKALDRRIATRWNGDFACLSAHVRLKSAVIRLTSSQKLFKYQLSIAQWNLTENLVEVLEVSGWAVPQPFRIPVL
jgi:hypothetical protein